MRMWGRRKLFSALKVLSAGLIIKSTRDRLTRENNQVSLHMYAWEPHIHESQRPHITQEVQRQKGKMRYMWDSALRNEVVRFFTA